MKSLTLIVLMSTIAWTNVQSAENKSPSNNAAAVEKILHDRDPSWYTYPTKFGDLKLVLEDGALGSPAESITLNDKALVNVRGEKDRQGNIVSLMNEIMRVGGTEYEPRIAGKSGHRKVKRMVILAGPDGNCIKQFIILDFTGKQPFVSKRFGYNPQDQSCLSFKGAKWGKRESYIYLEGPMTYFYATGGSVTGPI